MPGLAGELFAAAAAIDGDLMLRSSLADAGQPAGARADTVRQLMGSQLSPLAIDVLVDAVSQRWAGPAELLEAIESLGAQAAILVAEADGELDRVEDELFAFSQAVAGSAELQMALTDPSVPASAKATLVRTLLEGKATAASVGILAYAMGHLRGRRADAVIADLMDLAAEQRDRSVAQVRVARALEADQARRLAAALSRLTGRDVRLNVAVDPEVIGGVSVRIGGEVIDATVAGRLEQARRALVG